MLSSPRSQDPIARGAGSLNDRSEMIFSISNKGKDQIRPVWGSIALGLPGMQDSSSASIAKAVCIELPKRKSGCEGENGSPSVKPRGGSLNLVNSPRVSRCDSTRRPFNESASEVASRSRPRLVGTP